MTYPSGFSEALFVTGLSSPTAMAFAPDGRLFVCEQAGALRVVKAGALLATPFLTVSVNATGERGLLGIAFDPNFTVNNFLYVYYTTAASPIHNRVSRFTASGDLAVPGSELVILDLDNLSSATNHNGGAIHFGPDGRLFVAVGENANGANSQSFGNRLGKILRINSDGTIPGDNPLLAQTTGANQAIWALGLRNPFTFAFYPTNGRLHINDVGQSAWEEVNEGVAGSNYGWPTYEGFDGGDPNFRDPLIAYSHATGPGTGCAITGGAFYSGAQYPSTYMDSYFYADFCGQWIYRLPPPSYNVATAFATSLGKSAVDLQVFNADLYYLTRDAGGSVYRIFFSTSGPPSAVSVTPSSGSGSPQTFSFLYSDPNGFGDLSWAQMIVNASLTGLAGCYTHYDRMGNQVFLLNDGATAWLGPVTLGTATSVQNSQCLVNAASSSASGVGNNLTVNLNFTFKPAFAGAKNVYMQVQDNGGLGTGWQPRGTWTTGPDSPPVAVSVTPSSGSGSPQTFSFLYSDPNGFADLSWAQTIVNASLTGLAGCYTHYDRLANQVLLLNDSATAWLGPVTLGTATNVQNSQCIVNAISSSVSGVGNSLTVNLNLTFKPAFAGAKNVFIQAQDNGGLGTGWQQRGTWTTP